MGTGKTPVKSDNTKHTTKKRTKRSKIYDHTLLYLQFYYTLNMIIYHNKKIFLHIITTNNQIFYLFKYVVFYTWVTTILAKNYGQNCKKRRCA